MSDAIPEINGALLRMRREELGLAQGDLATRACLSIKQIKQIEEGGTSSFYSAPVKVTAAKKIGSILGLPEQSVFVNNAPEVRDIELKPTPAHEATSIPASIAPDAKGNASEVPLPQRADVADAKATAIDASALVSSNHTGVSSPPSGVSPSAKPFLKSPSSDIAIKAASVPADEAKEQPKSKNSLWIIIGLFVAALGLAAVMQPEPPLSAEPPPPLQVLPAPESVASEPSAPADTETSPATSVTPHAPASANEANAARPPSVTAPTGVASPVSAASAGAVAISRPAAAPGPLTTNSSTAGQFAPNPAAASSTAAPSASPTAR